MQRDLCAGADAGSNAKSWGGINRNPPAQKPPQKETGTKKKMSYASIWRQKKSYLKWFHLLCKDLFFILNLTFFFACFPHTNGHENTLMMMTGMIIQRAGERAQSYSIVYTSVMQNSITKTSFALYSVTLCSRLHITSPSSRLSAIYAVNKGRVTHCQ